MGPAQAYSATGRRLQLLRTTAVFTGTGQGSMLVALEHVILI